VHRRSSAVKTVSGLLFAVQGFLHAGNLSSVRRFRRIFSGRYVAGDKVDRIRGYHVAHIWEHVYDPECFTAGWNLCLMPGFLKLFTEKQDRILRLHQIIQQAAFDLYFKNDAVGLPKPTFVTDPGIDLAADFPTMTLNLLRGDSPSGGELLGNANR
jgi:hypothetical protein